MTQQGREQACGNHTLANNVAAAEASREEAEKKAQSETKNDVELGVVPVASSSPCCCPSSSSQENDDDDDNNNRAFTIHHDQEDPSSCCGCFSKHHHYRPHPHRRPLQIASLICILGCLATTAFVTLGFHTAAQTQQDAFSQHTAALVQQVYIAWLDYEVAALWTHQACSRHFSDNNNSTSKMTHVEFRELYEQIAATGIDVQVEYLPRVSHAERPQYEDDMRQFLAEYYPYVNYQGFVGLEPTGESGDLDLVPRSVADHYYPIHYMEPIPGSEPALDLDVNTRALDTLQQALTTWQPAISDPTRLVEETVPHALAVFLFHPGTPLSTQPNLQPRDLSLLVIRIPDLIQRATQQKTLAESTEIFLYDTTNTFRDNLEEDQELFLGRMQVNVDQKDKDNMEYELKEPMSLAQVRALSSTDRRNHRHHRLVQEETMVVADRTWTIVTVAVDGTYQPDVFLVIVGGVLLWICSLTVAAWVFSKLRYADMRKAAKLQELQTTAEQEKAALILQNAVQATQAERTLNDFIAHEVRNPVAAAMAACAFVRVALTQPQFQHHVESTTLQSVQEDVQVMDNSLNFVNDLLRNMLDMHRAASNQLQIQTQWVDVYRDVLQPVDSMLYRRGSQVQVLLQCPTNENGTHLIVQTDVLRLKQVMLNLGRNAAKFVETGFIKLTAGIRPDRGTVQLAVEDSGKGIPPEKRNRLFEKFQESLDSLNQGTGIGLSLCKSLVQLMGGEIWLDESYDSGIPGYPGTRFVVDLNVPPVEETDLHSGEANGTASSSSSSSSSSSMGATKATPVKVQELPEHMSVLFVDDDMIIRRLFCRALTNVAPTWAVSQAANGETALQLVKEKMERNGGSSFDLVFMDQYMASFDKQLLGTETVRELRAQGFKGRVCGLSANDIEDQFLQAGCDAFMFKPFPTQKDLLEGELRRILFS